MISGYAKGINNIAKGHKQHSQNQFNITLINVRKSLRGKIKNGQSRDTCNIGHKIQNEDIQKKKHKTKMMSNTDSTKFMINILDMFS